MQPWFFIIRNVILWKFAKLPLQQLCNFINVVSWSHMVYWTRVSFYKRLHSMALSTNAVSLALSMHAVSLALSMHAVSQALSIHIASACVLAMHNTACFIIENNTAWSLWRCQCMRFRCLCHSMQSPWFYQCMPLIRSTIRKFSKNSILWVLEVLCCAY